MLPKHCQTPFCDFKDPAFMRVSDVFVMSDNLIDLDFVEK